MPNSKTLLQAILAAFCAILFVTSALGGGGMNRRRILASLGSHTPTAKDYVQDGLIAMWDGIESEIDLTVKPVVGDVYLSSAGDIEKGDGAISSGYPFYSNGQIFTNLVNSNDFTVELIFKRYGSLLWRCGLSHVRKDSLYNSDGMFPKWFACNGTFYNVGYRSSAPYLKSIACVKSGTDFKIYENGVLVKNASTRLSSNADIGFQIGGTSWDATNLVASSTSFFRCSLYSRHLDKDEVLKNAVVDVARFNIT